MSSDPRHQDDRIRDFIHKRVDEDLRQGVVDHIRTRFPPEPNGYLHIGHAKAVCLNFGIAEEYGGRCNLRFDDTNPERESAAYAQAIEEDIRWLGFEWEPPLRHASDYFEQLHGYAMQLIRDKRAYVDSQSPEQLRATRGTLTQPGRDSPYRDRTVAENLELFERMRAGAFEEGEQVLRARIDMNAENLNLRDPVIYRIRKRAHHRTATRWCIYPTYDFTQCLSDAIEGVTHSLCTLEFEDHRPLYDWFIEHLPVPSRPRQYEFARLNLDYTVTSKRLLARLVEDGAVTGWDDPRMPTLSGLRRRGYPPTAIREFCGRIGLTKKDTRIDCRLLENLVRAELDRTAPRAMAVTRPLKLVITNYPREQVEELTLPRHPKDPDLGERTVPFSNELYIEQDDFHLDPPPRFRRLAPGREVRLRGAYLVSCERVVEDARGVPTEVHCRYDPATRGGVAPPERKVRGALHWVSARHAVNAEIRLYDHLLNSPEPTGADPAADLNPDSLETLTQAKLEPGLARAGLTERFQFERTGYFCQDSRDSRPERLVFNRIVSLRDSRNPAT